MAPRSINYSNSLDALRAAGDLFNYVHADYRYYKPDWDLIRDAIAGERRVKEQGQTYLPPLGKNAGTSYNDYKQRAVYVNMTARTVSGLIGTLFRRKPKLTGLSDELVKRTKAITPDGAPIESYAKTVSNELAQIGRVGLFVDIDAMGAKPPYLTYYVAENILSWKTEMIEGRETLVYVLLREIIDDMKFLGLEGSTAPTSTVGPDPNPVQVGKRQQRVTRLNTFNDGGTPVLRAQYRVLSLKDGVYQQQLFTTVYANRIETLASTPQVITPTRNGAPLNFIPFYPVGTNGVSAKVTKSPMYDIATLNFSHYRSSAQLEHGRFFTALPIYYVPVKAGQEGGEYTIGPSVVWEVPPDSKPGILEYYGTGLRELANSLAEKESHISQLGGRIMGISKEAASQSPEVAALTQANEVSVLTNLCDASSEGLTRALQAWAWWQNYDKSEEVSYKLNRDFASSNVGAREMRAIADLYKRGILPVGELHRVFQEAELIAEDTDLETFEAALNDFANFPGQPDVESMHSGYPDAQGELQWRIAKLNSKTTLKDTQQTAEAGSANLDKQTKHDSAQARADRQHELLVQKRAHEQQMQQQEVAQSHQADMQSEQARQTKEFEAQRAKNKPAAKPKPKK